MIIQDKAICKCVMHWYSYRLYTVICLWVLHCPPQLLLAFSLYASFNHAQCHEPHQALAAVVAVAGGAGAAGAAAAAAAVITNYIIQQHIYFVSSLHSN